MGHGGADTVRPQGLAAAIHCAGRCEHRPLQTTLPIYCTQNSTKKQLLFHEIDRAPQIGGVGQRDLRGQAVGVGDGRGGVGAGRKTKEIEDVDLKFG